MNEYIVHGENGILFQLAAPTPVAEAVVRHVLENVNRLFTGNIQRIIEAERKRGNVAIVEEKVLDFAIYRVGMPPYLRRKAITKGFYDNRPV